MNDVPLRPAALPGARHREMAAGRWWELTICEQMAHVGSEVGRTLNWRTRNPEIARSALERALELLDLTLADPRYRHSVERLREVARAREVLLDFLVGENEYGSTGPDLQRYFDTFAAAVARGR
ncbi:MAG: hypothetical protein V1774_07360 [Candidatus Eisenbacteria bacterium]